MVLLLAAQIIIVIIVVGAIVLFMFENFDKTKVAVTFSLLGLLAFLILFFNENTDIGDVNFLEYASEFINIEAIIIIFSVSIIVTLVKDAGFFGFVSLSLVKLTEGNQKKLFVVLGGLTFFISMFFDNLSAIILLGSLTIVICREIEVNPIPYILFVGMNTILGGLPTPVSSIPNIIYSSENPDVNFLNFAAFMFPLAIILFGITTGYFFLIFKKSLFKRVKNEKREQIARINPWSSVSDRKSIWKSIILLSVLFGGFLLTSIPGNPLDVALVALISSIIGLFIFKKNLKDILEKGVEWNMIVFFISLFILMGILNKLGVLDPLTDILKNILGSNPSAGNIILVALIIGTVGFLVNGLITVVPAAVVFSPIYHSLEIASLGLWFTFVLTGNISGSMLPVSSATILMALEIMKTEKLKFNFKDYLKYIIPITLILQILVIGYTMILIALNV